MSFRIGIPPFSPYMGALFINARQKKKDLHRNGADPDLLYAAPSSGFPTAAPIGRTEALQEEVYRTSAFRSDCHPVCSYADISTFYMDTSDSLTGSNRSVIFTPSSSARGVALAVLASSVSRMLPGQGYSIVTGNPGGRDRIAAPSIDTPT